MLAKWPVNVSRLREQQTPLVARLEFVITFKYMYVYVYELNSRFSVTNC